MFIGKYDKSVIVTYLGTLFILGGEIPRITGAIICLMIAGICDMFDGKVARMCKNRTEKDIQYGIQIDSLADMVSFIVYPIIIFYGVTKAFDCNIYPFISIPILTLFTVCGISRLAFFNINTATEKNVEYYSGLPVTSTAMIFPLIYLLRYVLSPNIFVIVYFITFAIIAFLMVYNFKVKKFKANSFYAICTILAIIMTAVLIILKVVH